jgi:hypothetical protein
MQIATVESAWSGNLVSSVMNFKSSFLSSGWNSLTTCLNRLMNEFSGRLRIPFV